MLESLTLINNYRAFSSHPTEEEIEDFTKGCRNLKYLHIESWIAGDIMEDILQCLGSNNPLLEALHMTVDPNGRMVKDSSFTCLFNGCSLLKDIKLTKFDIMTTQVFINATNITDLCLEDCISSNDTFVEIGKMKNLKSISLHRCCGGAMNGNTVIKLNCHTLEAININGLDSTFTNLTLSTIATNCPTLKSLSISFNKGMLKQHLLTTKGCWELFNKCEKHVELSGNPPTE